MWGHHPVIKEGRPRLSSCLGHLGAGLFQKPRTHFPGPTEWLSGKGGESVRKRERFRLPSSSQGLSSPLTTCEGGAAFLWNRGWVECRSLPTLSWLAALGCWWTERDTGAFGARVTAEVPGKGQVGLRYLQSLQSPCPALFSRMNGSSGW